MIQEYESGKELKTINHKTQPKFVKGDLILLKTHLLSKASESPTAELQPKRDDPYKISERTGNITYRLKDKNGEDRGLNSATDLQPYMARSSTTC